MTQQDEGLRRSLVASLAGGVVPALVGAGGTVLAAAVVPAADAATLLLAWTVVGYLTLTDFGLTRSASRLVASGRDPASVVGRLWRMSLPLGGALALLTLGLLLLARGRLAGADAPGLVALCLVPIAASLQFPLVGLLEAQGRFTPVALQRTLSALCTYLVPAVAMAATSQGLRFAVASIVGYRFVSAVVLFRATRIGPEVIVHLRSRGPIDGTRSLVTWLGVSSIVGPALLYVDRVLLAAVTPSVELWVYYVAVSELVMKTYVLPSAVLAVLFPRFVRADAPRSADLQRWLRGPVAATSLAAAGVAFVLVYLVARSGGIAMLAPTGVPGATTSVIAAVAMSFTVLNWSSQVYIAYLQSRDAQRAVSLVQLALAAPYLAALGACLLTSSVVGVAAAWGGRILAVWVGLWLLTRSAGPADKERGKVVPA